MPEPMDPLSSTPVLLLRRQFNDPMSSEEEARLAEATAQDFAEAARLLGVLPLHTVALEWICELERLRAQYRPQDGFTSNDDVVAAMGPADRTRHNELIALIGDQTI